MRSPEKLREVAQDWAEETLSSWFFEYAAWDGLIEDGELSMEEWKWIKENVRLDVEPRSVR